MTGYFPWVFGTKLLIYNLKNRLPKLTAAVVCTNAMDYGTFICFFAIFPAVQPQTPIPFGNRS